MAEHDPALVEKAAELIGECDDEHGWTDAPDSDGNGDLVYECSCGDTSPVLARQWVDNDAVARAAKWHRQHIARAVLDAVAPAIREAALLEAAQQSLDIAFGSNEDVRDWLNDMAAQQREENPDGR